MAEVEGEGIPTETFHFIIERVSPSSVLPVPDTIEGVFSVSNKKMTLTFPAMQFYEEIKKMYIPFGRLRVQIHIWSMTAVCIP